MSQRRILKGADPFGLASLGSPPSGGRRNAVSRQKSISSTVCVLLDTVCNNTRSSNVTPRVSLGNRMAKSQLGAFSGVAVYCVVYPRSLSTVGLEAFHRLFLFGG